MSRDVQRSADAISRHNAKWNAIYQARAELRRRYPNEFKKLRKRNTYLVALRLLAERHEDEMPPRPTAKSASRLRGNAVLSCGTCGGKLSEHSLSGDCR